MNPRTLGMGRSDEPLKEHRDSKRVVRKNLDYRHGAIVEYMFICPVCKRAHLFQTPKFKFNCNLEKPTVSPEIVTGDCHLIITDGVAYSDGKSYPLETF